MSGDREVLFGVLAIQLEKVSPDHLRDAMQDTAGDPTSSVSDALVRRGALSTDDERLLSALVDRTLTEYAGDAEAALESLSTGETAVSHAVTIPPELADAFRGPAENTGNDAALAQDSERRYRELGEHARGGIGRVLVVWDEQTRREIALKELKPPKDREGDDTSSGGHAPHLIARFLQEARVTAQLEHPSIIPVHEIGRRADGTLYYTMKFVRGQSLHAAIRNADSVEVRLKLLPHFLDLCQAIAYAHSKGVIHRDIKPANVMLGEFGETLVIDWGLAKPRDTVAGDATLSTKSTSESSPDAGLTMDGQVIGTPHYMAPEQALGRHRSVDERSDVYALGAVLYHLLTGRPPYADHEREEILHRVVSEELKPPGSLASGVPPALGAICTRALAKASDRRYDTARELADEIVRYQTGALVQAYQYRAVDRVLRFVNRYKPAVATAAIAAIALCGLAVYSYLNIRAGKETEHTLRIESDRQLYAVTVNLAEQHMHNDEMPQARTLMEQAPQEFRHWEWGHLQYAAYGRAVDLPGLSYDSWGVAYSPDGRYIVTFDDDSNPEQSGEMLQVWDLEEQKLMHRFRAHERVIAFASFAPDGLTFATIGYDDTKLWDRDSGALLQTLDMHSLNLGAVVFSNDGAHLIAGGEGGRVSVWPIGGREPILTYTTGGKGVQCLAVEPGGTRVAIAEANGRLILWDHRTGQVEREIDAHTLQLHNGVTGVTYLAFRPGYNQVATAGVDHAVRTWDLDSGEMLLELASHDGKVWSVAYSPDGALMASGSSDKTVKLWDAETGAELPCAIGYSVAVTRVAFSPDGASLAVGATPTVQLWDRDTLDGTRRLRGHTGVVNSVEFISGTNLVATAGGHWKQNDDDRAVVWNRETGEVIRELQGHVGAVFTIVLHPDGRRVATGGNDGQIIIWDVQTGEQLQKMRSQDAVRELAFHPDGHRMVTVGWYRDENNECHASIWDIESGKEVGRLGPHEDILDSVAWSPDGSTITTVSRDSLVRIWDAESFQRLHLLETDTTWAYVVSYSHGGTQIATGHASFDIHLWDVATGEHLRKLHGHSERIEGLAFSPDDQRLAASDLTAVKIWDVEAGLPLINLPFGGYEVEFSPDGMTLAAGGWDGTLAFWKSYPWEESGQSARDYRTDFERWRKPWHRSHMANEGRVRALEDAS
jgi:WD40 repeat protein/serine/threonine protein kinase